MTQPPTSGAPGVKPKSDSSGLDPREAESTRHARAPLTADHTPTAEESPPNMSKPAATSAEPWSDDEASRHAPRDAARDTAETGQDGAQTKPSSSEADKSGAKTPAPTQGSGSEDPGSEVDYVRGDVDDRHSSE